MFYLKFKILFQIVVLVLLPVLAFAQTLKNDRSGLSSGLIVETAPGVTGLARQIWVKSSKNTSNRFIQAAFSPESRALTFLNANKSLLVTHTQSNEFRISKASHKDELGMFHIKTDQFFNGVKVAGGQFLVHLDMADIKSANGLTLDLPSVFNVQATVSSEQARHSMEVWANTALTIFDFNVSQPELLIFNKGFYLDRIPDGHSVLAWRGEISAFGVREEVWVDANSGKPIFHFTKITDAKNRNTFDMNGSNSTGILVRTETAGSSSLADVNNAHNYAGDAYDYYMAQHNRDSYDGSGATVRSFVRFCEFGPTSCPTSNAFWTGFELVYGHGFPAADDVVAHEFTHAITENTANLVYMNQPGALNESFSDIFGETVDLQNNSGNDSASVRWDQGENSPFGAIRDMKDPNRFGDPARVGDPLFFTGSGDNGGVHTNSGVQNKAFALTVDGGSFKGWQISGIGLTKAGKIFYRALSVYLGVNSQFSDAFAALNNSCSDLIGSAGISSSDCQQVCKSLLAVEMNTTGGSCDTNGNSNSNITPILQLLLLD